jgi:sigma-54 dependent transcriptional regulator, acetoin dehydrogenase operon transcriptional activator AcoR
MSLGSVIGPDLPDQNRLAVAREHFLTRDQVETEHVRDSILASWWRSRRFNVAADHIDLSYVRDPETDTPLSRGSAEVLLKLRENLDGQQISIILTDAHGVVLSRMTADKDLERHLDGVQLAPGFSYAEEYVGTNGIGTALEGGQPMHVFGHEHYAEHLEALACAGVPIRHPISGKIIGAVDLTCWRKDADALLIALAKTTADQITQSLLATTGAQEYELLQEYLRACRRTAGIVLALNNDMVMMNDYARHVLDPGDQVALLGHAAEALAGDHAGPIDVELPTGARARMYCRPLQGRGLRRMTGGVAHVKLLELTSKVAPEQGQSPGPGQRRFLAGLVGSGPLWLRACHQVDAAFGTGEWSALEGEPGVGKLALLRAVHRRRNPKGTLHVLDCAEVSGQDWLARFRAELLEGEGTLVLRHVDRLSNRRLTALAGVLEQARETGRSRVLWAAATLGASADPPGAELAGVLQYFPGTVEVPPLRHHIEDLHELVPFFLSKLNRTGPLTCSPEAMQLLLRSNWPGNAEQLWQVLKRVVRRRRTGAIQPSDLPPECWTVSRRLLSPLESMERDAIVQSLLDCDGNKAKAAESLGMSRATIYRKIHEYGIVARA